MSYVTDVKMRILEPMCGSGRFIIPFLEEGFNIEGFDISDDMLNSCRERMKAKNLVGNVFLMQEFIIFRQKTNMI